MLNRFLVNEEGNVAIFGALLVLPLLMMIGVSVDYSRIETAKGEVRAAIDGAGITPSMMMSDMPAAERAVADFINANTGRETADVKIRIYQDTLQLEAEDAIDTPLLSVMGQAVSPVLVNLEYDVPQSSGAAKKVSAKANQSSSKRKNADGKRKRLRVLKKYERGLEKALMRLNTQQSAYPAYTRQMRMVLRRQLKEVRRDIRNAKSR